MRKQLQRKIRGTVLAMVLLASTGAVGEVAAQERAPRPAPPGSAMELLYALPVPVAVPDVVPEGFSIARVEAAWSAEAGTGYRILWVGPERRCFVVEAAADGFGGPVPERSRPIDPSGFDPPPDESPYHVYWSEAEGAEGPFPEPVVFSDWLIRERLAYRLISPPEPGVCERIAPENAVRIVESLAFLEARRTAPAAKEPAGVDQRGEAARWDLGAHLSISSLHPFVERAPGEPSAEVALRVLEELGFPPPEERVGELAVEQTVEVARATAASGDTVKVLVTREGGGDDSVAATRYLVVLVPVEDPAPGEGDVWQFLAGRQFACHEGRGHTGWSKELCL